MNSKEAVDIFISELLNLENEDLLFSNSKDREIFDKLCYRTPIGELREYSLHELNHLHVTLTELDEIEELIDYEELCDVIDSVPSSMPTDMVLV